MVISGRVEEVNASMAKWSTPLEPAPTMVWLGWRSSLLATAAQISPNSWKLYRPDVGSASRMAASDAGGGPAGFSLAFSHTMSMGRSPTLTSARCA
jgi:hypothetical protein